MLGGGKVNILQLLLIDEFERSTLLLTSLVNMRAKMRLAPIHADGGIVVVRRYVVLPFCTIYIYLPGECRGRADRCQGP
jgi:hypothetical protein